MPRVLGCYRLEDLEKVLTGLGLQALRSISISIISGGFLAYLRLTFVFSYRRVHMADHTAHLFLTRTSKEAQDVLWLLNLFSFPQLTSGVSLQRFVYLALCFLREQRPSLLDKQEKDFVCVYCAFYFISDYTFSCNLNGSWEKIQVKLLEKCICASSKMGIFLYSMLMFWKNDAEGTVI